MDTLSLANTKRMKEYLLECIKKFPEENDRLKNGVSVRSCVIMGAMIKMMIHSGCDIHILRENSGYYSARNLYPYASEFVKNSH